MSNVTLEDAQKRLQNMVDIQCSNGNWNCNKYMWGMANGLILANSILMDEEPQYLDEPERWLDDE